VPEGLNFKPLKVLPEKDSKPIVVFSGRLKRAKRPDHAIKAFAIVNAKIPKAELWVFVMDHLDKRWNALLGQG